MNDDHGSRVAAMLAERPRPTDHATTTTGAPIGVILISPHEMTRLGLAAMLGPLAQRAILVSSSEETARRAVVTMLDTDGLSADLLAWFVEQTVLAYPDTVVVSYSWDAQSAQETMARSAGASGCVSKALGASALLTALDYAIASAATSESGTEASNGPRTVPQPHGLSAREVEILILIADGLTNEKVATELYLSVNTVKSYIRSAYRKVGVSSRSQAVRWSIDHGLTRRGDSLTRASPLD